ncbi:MAG: nucleotide pyrophosphohydrolase [Candidatus Methylumidiphilus sp.]
MDIKSVQKRLREFAQEREWEQFHSPKNIATALAVEAAELLEPFQWLKEEESRRLAENPTDYARVEEEIADVMIYLLRLADLLEINLDQAVEEKIRKNAEKYPVALAKGNAVKYNRRDCRGKSVCHDKKPD